MTLDTSDGPTSNVELKTVDVQSAGDYRLSMEPGWRSNIRARDDDQAVTSGQFRFTRFDVKGEAGRAAGSVEFKTDKTSGTCTFDIALKVFNRDRLPR